MANTVRPYSEARQLSQFAESATLDENLGALAETATQLLGCEYCSIMLAERQGEQDASLTIWASAGSLPQAAYREVAGKDQGIAGSVLASGESLLLADIGASAFTGRARRLEDPRRSLMCVPIRLGAAVLGVINVSGRHAGSAFEPYELTLLETLGLCVARVVQVAQLQSVLNSRFAQMAVIHEAAIGLGNALVGGSPNPDQVAKIMAKSFYREMTRAGFGSRQIINAASEIITQLSGNLQRHSKRLGRDEAGALTAAPSEPPLAD